LPRARKLIDRQPVFAAVTVILEVLLRSTYGYRPADIARALRAFAGLPTVTVEDGSVMATALDLAEKGMEPLQLAQAIVFVRSKDAGQLAILGHGLGRALRELRPPR
jgi:hypothetical protein